MVTIIGHFNASTYCNNLYILVTYKHGVLVTVLIRPSANSWVKNQFSFALLDSASKETEIILPIGFPFR